MDDASGTTTAEPFPDGFLWGASTAGHQIEGGNRAADMWGAEWAEGSVFAEPSGDACDSYHRFGEDIALLADAGLDAYRFSIEWSRVEPEDGWFSRAELDHYRRMIGECREKGVTPVVTFNHFTTPRWFADRGGWRADDAVDRFGRYCEEATRRVGDLVEWACTLNEPNLPWVLRHVGVAPVGGRGEGADVHPGPSEAERARIAALRARSEQTPPATTPAFQRAPVEVMAAVHRRGVEAIRSGPGDTKVGWTLALIDVQAVDGGEDRRDEVVELAQGAWLDVSADDDFVGVQTYTRERIGPDGIVARPEGADLMLTGWEVYPPALEHTVRAAAARARVPVLVTEHGCATADDGLRIRSTAEALEGLRRCIADGVDVRGYLHWSLLDNFEWISGFGVTFGLIAVDIESFERRPKPSLRWLGEVARRNGLP